MAIAVADSGFVVAVANSEDEYHSLCVPVYRQHDLIYLPQSTLAEVGYLLTKEGGNSLASRFLKRLPQMRYRIHALSDHEIQRTAEILDKYVDSRVDFVDATIMAVAESLNVTRILTIDRRDFGMVVPKHTAYFEILP